MTSSPPKGFCIANRNVGMRSMCTPTTVMCAYLASCLSHAAIHLQQYRATSSSCSQEQPSEHLIIGVGMQGGSGRGLTSSEVMNDEATMTQVCLRGHVNTVPFVIERSIKRYLKMWLTPNSRMSIAVVLTKYLCNCLYAWSQPELRKQLKLQASGFSARMLQSRLTCPTSP